MPPKKQKVKVRKSSKSGGGKGVNIKIVIDQSKKTKGGVGVAPKPSTGMRQLPAFSVMPQGSSFLGASFPARQDAAIDINVLGDKIYNNLLAEGYRREQSARGFGSFQNAGQQLNQMFDGQYRVGRNNIPIISQPEESNTSKAIDYAVFDDPETNNQILGNKLNNRGSMLLNVNENSIGALNDDERRDNDLDNLVLHEKKSKEEAIVESALDEELREENDDNEEFVLQEITSPRGQEQRMIELSLQNEENEYVGKTLSPSIKKLLYETYPLPPYPSKSSKIDELKEYINFINQSFGTKYETNFKGKRAQEDLRRVIRVALLREYDDLMG